MSNIRDFLRRDPLGAFEQGRKERRASEAFERYLTTKPEVIWLCGLYRFAAVRPWNYWDGDALCECLTVLRANRTRSLSALSHWAHRFDVGFDNLLRTPNTDIREDYLSTTRMADVIEIATVFHPEYLRLAEHVYSNLLTAYWAVLKKKEVTGHFDTRGAREAIRVSGHDLLLAGYEDRVRNAIAHGEVYFTIPDILYGAEHPCRMSALEFLHTFDCLWRTCLSMTLGVLIFLADELASGQCPHIDMPPSIIAFLAASAVSKPDVSVDGAIQSTIGPGERALHMSICTPFRERTAAILECLRVSARLIEAGASDYALFMYELNHGFGSPSLLTIDAQCLAKLLYSDAGVERLSEALATDRTLLWYDESRLRGRIRRWKTFFSIAKRTYREQLTEQLRLKAGRIGLGRYDIKTISNKSSGRTTRIEVIAILRNPSDATDLEMLVHTIHEIVRKTFKMRMNPLAVDANPRWGVRRRPKYIWVKLFECDGTLRHLGQGVSGGLIAVAEKVRRRKLTPIFVPKPDLELRDIRFRFFADLGKDLS